MGVRLEIQDSNAGLVLEPGESGAIVPHSKTSRNIARGSKCEAFAALLRRFKGTFHIAAGPAGLALDLDTRSPRDCGSALVRLCVN